MPQMIRRRVGGPVHLANRPRTPPLSRSSGISGALAQDAIAIIDYERGDMLAPARRMQMDGLASQALES
jgi:hypothetical protein